VKRTADYPFYISGAVKLGVGFGIVSLLSRWVTANTILSSPETLIKYGLTGGIGYSLMGALALILFGFIAKKIRDTFSQHHTIGDVLRQKLTPSGFWLMIATLLLTSLYSLFIQAMGAGILLHIIFPVPIFAGMFLFLLFCFIVGGVGGMQRLHQLAGINVVLVFSAVILIPVYFYIQEGVYPVYEGTKLYHPYVLYIKNIDAIWFIFTAILIGFGQVLIDPATWQRVFILKKEKIRMTFTLAGLIWATIPLALSSLLLIIIFGRSYESIYSLLFELVDKIQSTILIVLFVLFCISVISSTIGAELHAMTTLIVRNVLEVFHTFTDREKYKLSFMISGALCSLLLVVLSILSPNPLELIFFFGNIYAALIVPMLCIFLSKQKLPIIIPMASLIGAVGGCLALIAVNKLIVIWVSFFISGIICFLFFIYQFIFTKDNTFNRS
jgi:uncharacterized integral membrane protein